MNHKRQWDRVELIAALKSHIPVSKVHGASMGPIWGRRDPGGPHVGPMDFAILDIIENEKRLSNSHFAILLMSASSKRHIYGTNTS